MPDLPISLTEGLYEARSAPLAAQNCINVFPMIPESPTVGQGSLSLHHGISEFADTLGGTGRSWILHKGEVYSVNGTSLYKTSSTGVVTNLGTIEGTDRCILAENGLTIAIVVPNLKNYMYGTDIGLLEIEATVSPTIDGADFITLKNGETVNSVTEKDSFFIFATKDRIFKSSAVTTNSGRDFLTTDFASAEVSTDEIMTVFTARDELYAAGTETMEVYRFNAATASGFPYSRVTGAHMTKGICGHYSVLEFEDDFVFVGGSKTDKISIWRGITGSRGTRRISTQAIDAKLARYTKTEIEAVCIYTYSYGEGFFALFRFPDTTFVYDSLASTLKGRNVWHEKQTAGSVHRTIDTLKAYGEILVQDGLTGKIGKIDQDTYQEFGTDISWSFTTPYLSDNGQTRTNYKIELYVETGTVTDSTDPQITMQISDDGGRTFETIGTKSMGLTGDTTQRLIWRRLGRFDYSRVWKFSGSAPIKTHINNLIAGIN